jgi:hypothetical protein
LPTNLADDSGCGVLELVLELVAACMAIQNQLKIAGQRHVAQRAALGRQRVAQPVNLFGA